MRGGVRVEAAGVPGPRTSNCGAWYKMKMMGSHVQKLLIKEIKVATAEPLTQLGATLSPEPCVMVWGAHA